MNETIVSLRAFGKAHNVVGQDETVSLNEFTVNQDVNFSIVTNYTHQFVVNFVLKAWLAKKASGRRRPKRSRRK